MFGSLDISTSALAAYRTKLDVIAGNIAMKDSFSIGADGEAIPYRRKVALFSQGESRNAQGMPGVHVDSIVEDPTPFGLQYDPGNPNAIQRGELKGYVRTSNVNYHDEMVNAMMASRAYEANVTVMEMSKRMTATSLTLLA
jgi:flagellar basal-body rod protein FlgC